MKRIWFCCLLVLLLSVPAFAVEDGEISEPAEEPPVEAPVEAPMEASPSEDPVTVETIKKDDEGVTVNVTIQQPEAVPVEDASAEIAEDDPLDILEVEEASPFVRVFSVSSLDELAPIPSADAPQNMADVVVSVLGEYQRKTYTVQEMDTNGNVISTSTEYVPGLAGLDYPWIAGAVFFALFLAGIFKLLGGLMRS